MRDRGFASFESCVRKQAQTGAYASPEGVTAEFVNVHDQERQ